MRIDLDALRVRIGQQLLIDDLDLTIEAGTFVGLVGPNGSGKSTLIKAVSRVLRSESGRVLFDGPTYCASRAVTWPVSLRWSRRRRQARSR